MIRDFIKPCRFVPHVKETSLTGKECLLLLSSNLTTYNLLPYESINLSLSLKTYHNGQDLGV